MMSKWELFGCIYVDSRPRDFDSGHLKLSATVLFSSTTFFSASILTNSADFSEGISYSLDPRISFPSPISCFHPEYLLFWFLQPSSKSWTTTNYLKFSLMLTTISVSDFCLAYNKYLALRGIGSLCEALKGSKFTSVTHSVEVCVESVSITTQHWSLNVGP